MAACVLRALQVTSCGRWFLGTVFTCPHILPLQSIERAQQSLAQKPMAMAALTGDDPKDIIAIDVDVDLPESAEPDLTGAIVEAGAAAVVPPEITVQKDDFCFQNCEEYPIILARGWHVQSCRPTSFKGRHHCEQALHPAGACGFRRLPMPHQHWLLSGCSFGTCSGAPQCLLRFRCSLAHP